jgi:hypothetical protein
MNTQLQRFKVIALDVWGHGPGEHEPECMRDGEVMCDGYTVNDAHYTGSTIEVSADEKLYNAGTPHESRAFVAEHAAIVRALVEASMLTAACTPESIEIDGEDDSLLFVNLRVDNDPEDGKPLLQLERVACMCRFDTKPSYSAHEHHATCAVKKE